MKSTIFIAGVFVALLLSLAYMTTTGDRHPKHGMAKSSSEQPRATIGWGGHEQALR